MLIFAERLRKLRKIKGLNQIKLAKRLKVSKAIISFRENNQAEPTAPNIKTIAQFFGVSSDFLIGLKEEEI